MKIDSLKDEIVERLPSCTTKEIMFVWKVLYEDWEDIPETKQEAMELIEEELSCIDEFIKIKKIHKKLFIEDTGDE